MLRRTLIRRPPSVPIPTLSQFPSIGLISILPFLFSCRPHLQVSNLRRDPNYSFYYNNCLRLLILNIIPFVLLVFFNTKIYQDIQVRRRGRKGDLMSVCFGSAWLLPLHGGGGGGEGFSIPTNPLLSYTLLRSPFPTAVQTFPLLHVAQISLGAPTLLDCCPCVYNTCGCGPLGKMERDLIVTESRGRVDQVEVSIQTVDMQQNDTISSWPHSNQDFPLRARLLGCPWTLQGGKIISFGPTETSFLSARQRTEERSSNYHKVS